MLETQPSEPTSPDITPTYDVPGEAFIDRNETAGLPGTDVEKFSQKQAEKFVSVHKRGLFGRMGRHRGPSSSSAPKRRKEDKEKRSRKRSFFKTGSDTEGETDTDIEMSADSRASFVPAIPGRGVLSALLQLYEHPSGSQSGTSTPGRSTPGTLTPGRASIDETFMPPSLSTQNTFSSAQSAPVPSSSGKTGLGLGLVSPAQWAKKSLAFGESRPPQTRNAAGVFGPLIASTGNISGAAAPIPSTVAPNIKRPGYHLSRYSLESNLPTVPRPAVEATRRRLTRPRSTHFEKIPLKGPILSVQPSSPPDSVGEARDDSPESVVTSTSFGSKYKWTGVLKNLPQKGWSRAGTPSTPGTPVGEDEWLSEKHGTDDWKKEKRKKRKKAEIYVSAFPLSKIQNLDLEA